MNENEAQIVINAVRVADNALKFKPSAYTVENLEPFDIKEVAKVEEGNLEKASHRQLSPEDRKTLNALREYLSS